jgi:hypothetical protein
VRKLRGFRGQTQETDRIMAAQNHAEQEQNSCWQDHKRRGRMILSSHDSVFFHLVAAWPRCAHRGSAVNLFPEARRRNSSFRFSFRVFRGSSLSRRRLFSQCMGP